jgi:hypothetical protein
MMVRRFLSLHLPLILVAVAALALFHYTSARAVLLSMTHDESSSFLIWRDFFIFKCAWSPDCWGTANLHWLYVLLMKGSIALFGTAEWALRLPALLGHLIYLFFSWQLVKTWVQNPWTRLAGFLLLNVNPFLLEFFSLARGYGLACACLMASVYYLSQFAKNNSARAATSAFLMASLAVLTNFTLLNYYACLVAAFGGLLFLQVFYKNSAATRRQWKTPAFGASVHTLVLALLLFRPIQMLMGRGEFEYGAPTFWEACKSLLKSSLYGVRYLNEYNLEFFGGLLALGLLLAFGLSLRDFLKTPLSCRSRFFLAATAFPLLGALASVSQHYLLGSEYLTNRTALLYIPLSAVALFTLLARLDSGVFSWWKIITLALVISCCLTHAGRSFQFERSYEWYYDSETKRMVASLSEILTPEQRIKLGVHWIFNPTTNYYLQHAPYDFAEKLTWDRDLRTDGYYDYYYVQPGDLEQLSDKYEVLKEFGWVGRLLRRKDFAQ